MIALARVLIPGVLAGVAISLLANIVIGGIFNALFNGTDVGMLVGTLTASVVGAILGVIVISTANRKGAVVLLRGAAAGAFIGVVGVFLGSIRTVEIDGIGTNVEFISVVVGVIVGAAGLRGTGLKFFSPRDDDDEDLGTLGKSLDGMFAGIMAGVVCGVPINLFNVGIFISPELIDRRTRLDLVRVVSIDELLVGGILGVIIGAVIGLVLSRKGVDGLLNGTLVGAMVGIVLALPDIIVMTFTDLGGFTGVMPHFGRVVLAMIGGGALGAAMSGASFIGRYRSALVGAGIGAVFVLPFVIFFGLLAIYAGNLPDRNLWENFLSLNSGNGIYLVTVAAIGAATGLIVDTLIKRRLGASVDRAAVCIVAIAAAIGVQGSYFFFLLNNIFLYRYGIGLPRILFDEQFTATLLRLAIGIAIGTLAGLAMGLLMKLVLTRPNPDRKSLD